MLATATIPDVCADRTDRSNRDAIVVENLPLVRAIAIRVCESLPVHVELDDLIHAGILGLLDAATRYDAGKSVAFSSYAKHRIRGAILDSLRELDWASRDLRRRQKQSEQVARDLAAELHRAPTEAELADRMGMSLERWRQVAMELQNVSVVSSSSKREGEEGVVMEHPCGPESLPDEICAREEMRSKLHDAMQGLPERYRKVVVMYYSGDMTMKEIGGRLGVNESRVSQIHKSALEKMAAALSAVGVTARCCFS